MGYNGQYYDKFVPHTKDCSNKISDLQKYTNKQEINETKELINKILEEFLKDKNLKYENKKNIENINEKVSGDER